MTEPLKLTVPPRSDPDSAPSEPAPDAEPADPGASMARQRAPFLDELRAIRRSKARRGAAGAAVAGGGQRPPDDPASPETAAEAPHPVRHETGAYEAPSIVAPAATRAPRPPARDASHAEPGVAPPAPAPEDAAAARAPFESGERDFAEELQRLIGEPEPPARRRWRVAGPIAKITGIVGVSAVAALLVVTLGDMSPSGGDPAPAERDTAAGESDAAADDSADAQTEQAAAGDAGSADPAGSEARPSFGPNEARAAEPTSSWEPVAEVSSDGQSVRQIEMTRPADSEQDADGVRIEHAESGASWSPPAAEAVTADAPSAGGDEDGAAATPETAESVEETGAASVEATTPSAERDAGASFQTASTADDADAGAAGQPGQATVDVNMREAPENDATVLTVIPADSELELIGCDIWCEVVYDGQQGWVFRDFVADAQ